MTSTDFKTQALIEAESSEIPQKYKTDSLATIQLQFNHPEKKEYIYSSASAGFVVFSEMYYAPGWQAYIDNQPTDIYRVNYVLRGLAVPAGEHSIRFEFSPSVVTHGSWIQLAGISVLLSLMVWGVRKRVQFKTNHD